jgi:hypothetical protein
VNLSVIRHHQNSLDSSRGIRLKCRDVTVPVPSLQGPLSYSELCAPRLQFGSPESSKCTNYITTIVPNYMRIVLQSRKLLAAVALCHCEYS